MFSESPCGLADSEIRTPFATNYSQRISGESMKPFSVIFLLPQYLRITTTFCIFARNKQQKTPNNHEAHEKLPYNMNYNTYFNDNVNKPPLLNSFNELKVPIIKRKCMRKKEMYKIAVI